MDDRISNHLFCYSFDSRLRLLLRLVKVLLEYGLSRHAADYCLFGWFRDGSAPKLNLGKWLDSGSWSSNTGKVAPLQS
jgi:hypothetical protein